MIVEVGNYTFPEQVGYRGWVAFEKYVAFEGLDGQVTIVERGRTSLVFWGGERDDEELFYPVFRTSYW